MSISTEWRGTRLVPLRHSAGRAGHGRVHTEGNVWPRHSPECSGHRGGSGFAGQPVEPVEAFALDLATLRARASERGQRGVGKAAAWRDLKLIRWKAGRMARKSRVCSRCRSAMSRASATRSFSTSTAVRRARLEKRSSGRLPVLSDPIRLACVARLCGFASQPARLHRIREASSGARILNDWGGGDYRDLMAGVDRVIAMGIAEIQTGWP